jgi:hypothetical protein
MPACFNLNGNIASFILRKGPYLLVADNSLCCYLQNYSKGIWDCPQKPFECYSYTVTNTTDAPFLEFTVEFTNCYGCFSVYGRGGKCTVPLLAAQSLYIKRQRNGQIQEYTTYCESCVGFADGPTFVEQCAEWKRRNPAVRSNAFEPGDIYTIRWYPADGMVPANEMLVNLNIDTILSGTFPTSTPEASPIPTATPAPTDPTPTPFATDIPMATATNNGHSLWLVGNNYFGQLGDGTYVGKSSLVQTGLVGNYWKTFSCGYRHAAGILTNNSLYLWGDNSLLQVNGIEGPAVLAPLQLDQNEWKNVSCGYSNTAAIRNDGRLFTWGQPIFGALGNDQIDLQIEPVETVAGGTDWFQVSVGGNHMSAIKNDGSLWLWGSNSNYQLGNPSAALFVSSPIQSFYSTNDWAAVECGYNYTLAIKQDGTAWAWGANYGNLGLGVDSIVVSVPTAISTVTGVWGNLAASAEFAGGLNSSFLFTTPVPSGTQPTTTPTPTFLPTPTPTSTPAPT